MGPSDCVCGGCRHGLAVVSGAAGWDTAHRLLAAVALPPLIGLVALAWVSARPLLPAAIAALVLFGLAALLTGRDVHLVLAALAFAAAALLVGAGRRAASAESRPGELRDYVTLTKPRVMSLLLADRRRRRRSSAPAALRIRAPSPRRSSGSRSPAAAPARSTTTSTATSTR